MKPVCLLPAFVICLCFADRAPAATETLAASRLVTVYLGPRTDTAAVSRLIVVYQSDVRPNTLAASRMVTTFLPANSISTRATSRVVTAWVGFSLPNAIASLRIAAGLQPATAREAQIYNLVTTAPSASVVDILDAYRVALYALHPEYLP
ncbi:MAG TPA: hypothetical protein VGM51_14365 [Armatimonadota bacterium]|jgi:hypothetical protein